MKIRQKSLRGMLVILVLLVAATGAWFWKEAREFTEPDTVEPAQITDSSRSGSREDPLESNANSSSRQTPQSAMPVGNAIDAFEDWMERYFNADPALRDQLTEAGATLAERRRSELKSLIQEDPQTALALAIPYEIRRELPPAIIERLEAPLSDYASYELEVYCLDPDHSSGGYQRLATIGETQYKVFTYGRRLEVTTKERLSIHGMAIDEVLALGEDPVRVLSEAERLDLGFNSERVVAVGNAYYEWTDQAALNRLGGSLRQDEAALGPRPGVVQWELPRGEVEGVTLLLAEDPFDMNRGGVLPEMYSNHTEGTKTMLYIRARFSNQDADHEPIELATLKERQAGCEAFWYENSYGKSSLTTTFTDTITLPYSASHYADRESEHLKTLFEDALPLAKAAGQAKSQNWDAASYDFYTMVTTGGDWDYGGRASVGGRRSHLNGSSATRVRTASHEFGHNLGLFHANYWRTDSTSPIGRDSIPGGYVGDEEGDEWIEYGHKFSVMSGQRGNGDLNEGRGHYTTGEKVKLNWLVSHDGDWVRVNQTTATPIRLYRQDVKSDDFADRSRGVARAIKIDVDSGDYAATDKRRYWLSYRRLPTNGIAEDWLPYGLQIDWQQETYGKDGSIQLDMTPYTRDDHHLEVEDDSDNRDKEDAVVIIGRTYSDEVADIHFTPIAQGGENPNEWIDVLVNIGTQDENTGPEITSFTASSTAVGRYEMVEFSVDAEDEDGDTLYYSWTFGDNAMVVDSLNSNTTNKSWTVRDVYTARVTVSDGKGGSDSKEIYIEVGRPSRPFAIKGRVIAGGFPVQGARVNIANEEQAWTDGNGNYVLPRVNRSENWLTAAKEGMRFEPLFSNPVYLTNLDATGRDWVAIGDGPASGSLQLAVTPYYSEIPILSQIEFKVLAWDASGRRIEANPAWSLSGGGTITESGLFTLTESGGPFWVTATQGSSEAHALIEVSDKIVVGIIALTPQVSEPGLEDAIFRIKRYGSAKGRLSVSLEQDGTAIRGRDYKSFNNPVEIPSGETFWDLKIDILDDDKFEPVEELILTIRQSDSYAINGAEASASIEILDDSDGAPIIHLTSPRQPLAIMPNGAGLYLEVTIDRDDSLPHYFNEVTVSWSVLDAPEGGAVTFSPPQGLATVATFNVPGFYKILISANDGINTGTSEIPVYAGLIPGSPSSDDKIIYMTMDEGEGITAKDSRGGDNNGALINGASWTGPGEGISGTGIVLDGIDDEIHIKSTDEINLPDLRERTIALWFKAYDPLRESKQVLYEEGGATSGLNIYLEKGRLYVSGWNDGVNDWYSASYSQELVDTNWHHVALVLNAEANFQFHALKGFLDGLEYASNGAAALFAHAGKIAIGARNGTRFDDGPSLEPGFQFAGIVDEFHMWNRALSHLELGLLFNIAYIGPELTLSSVDYSTGGVVIPSEMGIVLDGDTPGSSSLETQWETVIAPEGGEAIFENPTRPSTYATFPTPGYYKLRLSADDGQQKSAIDVDVHAGLDVGSNFQSPQEVVYFSMDEGSGEIVGNSAEENYPGSLSNPSGWTSEGGGISGTGIQFDGIDDVLIFEEGSPLESPSEKKSFALWIRPNEIGTGEKEIIFKLGEISNGFNIYLDGNMLYFGGWNNSQFSWETFLAVPITRGRWHHLALVLDADYSGVHPNAFRAYLNGRHIASGLASGMDSYIRHPDLGRITVGSLFHDGPPESNIRYAYSGILDEFHAYNDYALTIDEIGMLYAFGNVGPTVDAGPDQLAVPIHRVTLTGSSTDDERWTNPVQYSWHFVDRPEAGTIRLLENNGPSAQLDLFAGGSYRIALRAYDGQVTTFDELIVTVDQPTYFDLFMADYSVIAVEDRGYDADPDGDRRTNLAEYAMGGAPDGSEAYFQLGLQYELVPEAGNWYAEFRYPQRRDAALRGLRYEFQVSGDLSPDSWRSRSYTVLDITPIDDIFEAVHLRIDQPVISGNSLGGVFTPLFGGGSWVRKIRMFGRVKIVLNE